MKNGVVQNFIEIIKDDDQSISKKMDLANIIGNFTLVRHIGVFIK